MWALMGPLFDRWSIVSLVLTLAVSVLRAVQWGISKGLRIALVAALIYILMSSPTYLRARKKVYRKDGPPWDTPRAFRFSEGEILVQMDGRRDSILPWREIQRVSRRRGFIFVFFTRDRHYPIPNDAFESESDREAFFRLVDLKDIPVTRT